jgi:hypothetical protein
MLVLALQLREQVHDLGLDGHVEGRGGLVGDDHVRLQGQRHGDHDALAHTAGELVRVVVHPRRGGRDLHPVHQLDGLGLGLLLGEALVDAEHLAELVAHGEHRVQRAERVLEDHGDPPAADLAALLGGHLEHVLAAEEDLALRDPGRRHVEDAHDRLRGHRLAGAGLAEHGEGLAGVDVVVDAVDGPYDTLAGGELDVQVTHFEQRGVLAVAGRRYRRCFFDDGHVRLPQRVFGSRALRTASPSMMNASTVMVSMIDG